MLNIFKSLFGRAVIGSVPSGEPVSAGHGLDRRFSQPIALATLPPDRRGRLKNGNRPGDFLAAQRCGARTRCGGACRQPAMPNGRCRLHGGLTAGPRTAAGLARSRRARLTHGARSAGMRALLREARLHMRRSRALRARLTGCSAGHGVHRSNTPSTVGARCARPPSPPTASSSTASRPADPRARAVRPYTNPSNDGVSAGHGVHRSVLRKTLVPDHLRGHSPRRQTLLSVVAPLPLHDSASLRLCVSAVNSSSAGHGVHRSFSPAIR
jgi:hypothetical protein